MIKETKNTSTNKWCFDKGYAKFPFAVILSILFHGRYVFVDK